MSALAEALVAAQRRALSAMEKAYVAGIVPGDAQTRAIYHGTYLERCVCGAYGFGHGHWTRKL